MSRPAGPPSEVWLSIVIPAYDEAERLPDTLERLRRWLDRRDAGEWAGTLLLPAEVIVVDDGSQDATGAAAHAAAASWPALRVLRQDVNRGKGAAVQRGMLEANGAVRLFMDADLAASLDSLPGLLTALARGADVAVGSRALSASVITVPQGRVREGMGRFYNRLVRALVIGGIRDTQCGFKAFTAAAAADCFGPLRTPRFGFDVEVLLRARRLGYAIAEVPVEWRHVGASSVRPGVDSLAMLRDLLLVRWRMRQAPHPATREDFTDVKPGMGAERRRAQFDLASPSQDPKSPAAPSS